MAWSIASPWLKAPDSSAPRQADNALPACPQIKDVSHKPSEVEKRVSDVAIAMKARHKRSSMGTDVVGRRSQDPHRSEEDREFEDTVAELPTTIPAGSRLRESKLPPRPRDSTNPYTIPEKTPQYPDDDHRQSFYDIPLSGRQENFDAAYHDRGELPSEDSIHKASNSDDCGAPYPLADSMPILSPDPYGRDFDKYQHATTPGKETFSAVSNSTT